MIAHFLNLQNWSLITKCISVLSFCKPAVVSFSSVGALYTGQCLTIESFKLSYLYIYIYIYMQNFLSWTCLIDTSCLSILSLIHSSFCMSRLTFGWNVFRKATYFYHVLLTTTWVIFRVVDYEMTKQGQGISAINSPLAFSSSYSLYV